MFSALVFSVVVMPMVEQKDELHSTSAAQDSKETKSGAGNGDDAKDDDAKQGKHETIGHGRTLC